MAVNTEAVLRSKLRVDARKWMLSKLLPKKYGALQRLEHSGPGGAPIKVGRALDDNYLVTEAIRLGLVDRLPPALREKAERQLSAGVSRTRL